MSWNNAAVTNAGVALLNESLAGHILTITSAVGGAGTLEDQELASAVDVVDQKQTFSLMGLEDLEQGKQVGVQISNKGVSESYILHQIGVKAKLEYEEEETLLFLLQDDRGVEIPAEAENPDFLFEVYATIAISNKANITINVNPHVVASVDYVDRTFVKLTRKINGKDLSQDVTLTGEDIPVSEEDDTDLKTALANKAALINHFVQTDALGPLEDGMHRCTDWESLPPDTPDGQGYIISEDWLVQDGTVRWGHRQFISPHDELIWINSCVNGTWLGWKKLATATPPQEYDLPLMEEWHASHSWDKNCYCKTQDGFVTVNFSAENTGDVVSEDSGYVISYLPEGFRPSSAAIGVCGDYNYLGSSIYQCWVHPDGALVIYSPSAVPKGASGTIIYRAT